MVTYTFTKSGLVNLDSLDSCLLKVDNFIPKGKCELLALQITRDICTWERPVKNGDRSSKHAFHGLLCHALSVATPLDSDGVGTADIGHNNGGTDIATPGVRNQIETVG